MWECGLKSPQAEEASNPSLNGGPSAVARNAADHRLSCIIDSSPVSVAKSIRMLLPPVPAAVLTQGSAPIPAPSLSLPRGPCRPVLLLPMGSFAAGSLQLRGLVWGKTGKRHPLRGGCSPPSISESKGVPLVLITEEQSSASSGVLWGKRVLSSVFGDGLPCSWRECSCSSSRDSRLLLWPWGSAGGRPEVWASYKPPVTTCQGRSNSGGRDQAAAFIPAPDSAQTDPHPSGPMQQQDFNQRRRSRSEFSPLSHIPYISCNSSLKYPFIPFPCYSGSQGHTFCMKTAYAF